MDEETGVTSAAVLTHATPSLAWKSIKTGKITDVDVVTNGVNFGFRVYMDETFMCGTSENWAYISRSEGNCDEMVPLLTTAYLNVKMVAIRTNRNESYCSTGYIKFW